MINELDRLKLSIARFELLLQSDEPGANLLKRKLSVRSLAELKQKIRQIESEYPDLESQSLMLKLYELTGEQPPSSSKANWLPGSLGSLNLADALQACMFNFLHWLNGPTFVSIKIFRRRHFMARLSRWSKKARPIFPFRACLYIFSCVCVSLIFSLYSVIDSPNSFLQVLRAKFNF